MSVGEALVYGLLGGTAAASEHYVTDWRDRVKRERDKSAEEGRQDYQTTERVAGQEHQTGENEAQRTYTTKERRAGETFQAGQNQLTRDQQTKERQGAQTFTTSERDQDVIRKEKAYEDTLKLDKKYREPGTQYTWNETGDQLIPVQPGSTAFGPPVAEMDKDGKFQWFSTGTGSGSKGKGLLSRSGSSTTGKATDSWTTIEIPTGGPMGGSEKRSIYTDSDNKQWQVVNNNEGNSMLVPFNAMQEAPISVSPEQQLEANKFAENTVNDIAGWFSSDATDFADWGGSPEAAKEYFRQNYLQGNQLDESGRLRLPTAIAPPGTAPVTPQQAPAQRPVVKTNDRTDGFIKMYETLDINQQDILQQAIKAMQIDKRDPALVRQRLLDNGFTPDQLSYIF